jgi:O-methyltransferase
VATPTAASDSNLLALRKRYLEAIKKTLSFDYWEEPGVSLEEFRGCSWPKEIAKQVLTALLKPLKLRPVQLADRASRDHGELWPMYAFTMIGNKRLDNLQFCVETVLQENIPGDLIETGVWRGGACILMKAVLTAYGDSTRILYVADSFEGLPEADLKNFPKEDRADHHQKSFLAVSQEVVTENFSKFDLLDNRVIFLKGWFKDSLPKAPLNQLSVLRLDGDIYQSTWEALTNLYPKLSSGGFCIIDDYSLTSCKQAVHDYREREDIRSPLIPIDRTAVYWRV